MGRRRKATAVLKVYAADELSDLRELEPEIRATLASHDNEDVSEIMGDERHVIYRSGGELYFAMPGNLFMPVGITLSEKAMSWAEALAAK